MVVISFFIVAIPACIVFYWLGRGRRLNRELAQAAVSAETATHRDALVNLETGEVIEPGSAKYERAKRSGVRFEP